MDEQPSWAWRERAESFGTMAAEYDRFRPSYPDALIADLVELQPRRVLDVGCGTGKVSVLLQANGLSVLGLEVDPKMADVARSHGIVVEVAAFEDWDAAGRTFELITCGQAWHWVDPARGLPKAAGLLEPDGTLALFWNYDELEGPAQERFEAVYREHAPGLKRAGDTGRDWKNEYVQPLKDSGLFAAVDTQVYRWDKTFTADDWIGRAATHSDHIAMPAGRRGRLLDALRAAIDDLGGTVATRFSTYAVFARVPARKDG